MESIDNSEISEWYRDKTVFLTGGTGFMGKVLVEKLLRSCPVKKIFLLMRPKANNDINQRIDDMLNYKVSLVLNLYLSTNQMHLFHP
jgi:fatty acyl-CoA reductase